MSILAKISQIIDTFDKLTTKELLFKAITDILSKIATHQTSLDPETHKTSVILPKPDLLDYCLKRSIKGCGVESQQTQRNFLILAHSILDQYHSNIPLEKLLSFVASELSSSSSINKTERNFFAFAYINLVFKIHELTSEKNSENLYQKSLENLIELTKRVVFSKKFIASELISVKILDNFHVTLLEKIIGNLKPSNCFDFELLASVKLYCLDNLKSITDPECRKKVTKISQATNESLKETFSPKFMIKLFEEINLNPNFQEEENTSSIYGLISGLFLAHKDCKFSKVLELFDAIQKIEADKSSGFKKQTNFVFLMTEYLPNVPDLDSLVSYCEVHNQTNRFSSLLKSIITNRYIKSKRSAFSWQYAQKQLSAFLQKLNSGSPKFQYMFLKLVFSQKDLMNFNFPIKDVLLHKLENENAKAKILEELLEEKNNAESLLNYKASVSKITLLLTSIMNKNPSLTNSVLESLFHDYVKSRTLIKKMEGDLKDHSKAYLKNEVENFIFEKLSQVIFKKGFRKLLLENVEKWIQVNKIEDEFGNLNSASELFKQENKKSDSLAVLNCFLMFQNYRAEEQGIESIVFNQSLEDVSIFSQNLINNEKSINSNDFRILTDVLVSLLNCPSHEIRELVRELFENLSYLVDENVFDVIENAVFREKNENDEEEEDNEQEEEEEEEENKLRAVKNSSKELQSNGTHDEEDNIEEEEKDSEESEDENEDEDDIVIGGSFF